jgi:pimeloyl-ACP methyl ester carboxylesterase
MVMLSRREILYLIAGSAVPARALSNAASAPIDETGFVPIGGIDQWMVIQGVDATNPAILYLHGGPGEARSPFLKLFLPWEQTFTVTNWDQRGSGKTFGRYGLSTHGMTLDRLVDDAIEVAQHVCGRLRKKKVILVGQSWGSWPPGQYQPELPLGARAPQQQAQLL